MIVLLIVTVSVPLLFTGVSAAECGVEDYLPRCDEIVNTDGAFIITLETSTHNQTITIPVTDDSVEYGIIWDDGNADRYTGDASFTYRTPSTKTITIEKTFPGINFENNVNSALKLKEIIQWGDVKWSTMEGAFSVSYTHLTLPTKRIV